MRRTPRTTLPALAFALALTAAAACGSGSSARPDATTTTTTTATTLVDAELQAVALSADDLPAGFRSSSSVDDTITAFCAAEDAAAGLHARAREVRGFTRDEGGLSVIQLAFRFVDDDAARFVAQADAVLTRCSGVPDVSGLAFDYDALSPALATLIARTDASTGRHGVNVGSGKLTIDVVVLQHGDVGQLVAVLGVDVSRAALDALAVTAVSAAIERAGTRDLSTQGG
ncbi:MAG: hypothetical protein ACT4OV_05110 [Microthrixaceae bacterium]